MIRLRTIFGQAIRVQAHFCSSQKPDQSKKLFMNPKPQFKNFGHKEKPEHPREPREQNAPKQFNRQENYKKQSKQVNVLFGNKKTEEVKPKIEIESQNYEDLYKNDQDDEFLEDVQNKKQSMLFSQQDNEQRQRTSLRSFNTILKKKKEIEKSSDEILQNEIAQSKNIQDDIERQIHLMQVYGQHQLLQNVKEIFQQSKQFNSGVYSAYIIQLTNWSREVSDYQEIKKLLLNLENKVTTLKDEVFQGVYQMIFSLPLYPFEKIVELEFLIKFTQTHNLKTNYHISQLLNLLSEYQSNQDINSLKRAVNTFSQYLDRFVNKNKGKIDISSFDIKIAFSQAVQLTILSNQDYTKPILSNIKNMQVLVEKVVDQSDLVRYGQYLSTLPNSFNQIFELFKGFRDPRFIFHFERGLKMLDENGKEVQCVTKEQLEELYFEKKNHLYTRQQELFALFAERLDHPALITEIFKEQKQNKQNEYSSYLYLKALNVLTNNSDGTNLSNGVHALCVEAEKHKLTLPKVTALLNQVKAQIKENKYNIANELFNQVVIKDVIVAFQKEKIKRFLLKYIQTNLIGFQFSTDNIDFESYFGRLKMVAQFLNSLSPDYAFHLYNEERTDNFLLESLIGEEDIFEFNKKNQIREAFHQFQNDVNSRRFDFTRLIDPKTEEAKLQREIFDNYAEYVNIEKQNLIVERRTDRIHDIINQIDPFYFEERTQEQMLTEVINAFGRKALERDLLHSDLDEFPESEIVQQLQLKFKETFAEKQIPYEKYPITQLKWEDNALNNFIQETQKAATIAWKKSQLLKTNKTKIKAPEKTKKQILDELMEETIKENDELQGYKTDTQNVEEWKEYLLQIAQISDLRKKLEASKDFLRQFISVNYSQDKQDLDMQDEEFDDIEISEKDIKKEQMFEEGVEQFETNTTDSLYFSQKFQMADFLQLKYVYYNAYSQNDKYIHVPPSHYQNDIWDLLAWGLKNQEPMAIKLVEQYCNLVGTQMPEYLAKMVANFYKYQVGDLNSPIRRKWLKCLETVTNVNMTKVYQHVTDPAFISEEDIDFLHSAELRQEFKGVCRSLLNTTYSYRKFVRYGVTQRELLM